MKPVPAVVSALRAVGHLADHGPSGAVRPIPTLLQRLQQEVAEAHQARTRLEKAEEAADVMYYALLIAFNAPQLAGLSLGAVVRAMFAKYAVRFIVNARRKDREAEYQAIAKAIEDMPRDIEKVLRGSNLPPSLHG